MKLYIAVDIEGVAGVVGTQHLGGDGPDYAAARRWLTNEVNAAIRGARRAGVTSFAVQDGHGSSINILRDDLDEDAMLIYGSPGRGMMTMVQGIDSTYDVGGFVGYHARLNSVNGVLDHTAYRTLRSVRLNDTPVGEYGLVGAYMGYYGIPVVFAAGDPVFEEQIRALVPNIAFARIKSGLSRTSAMSPHPRKAEELIAAAAEDGLRRWREIRPIVFAPPITLTYEFHQPMMAQLAAYVPGVERVDDSTLKFTHSDYRVVYGAFVAMGALAGNVTWMFPL